MIKVAERADVHVITAYRVARRVGYRSKSKRGTPRNGEGKNETYS